MARVSRLMTTGFALSAFLAALVFCCCITQNAEAKEVKNVPACHKHNDERPASPQKSEHECNCSKKLSLLSSATASIEAPVPVVVAQFELPYLYRELILNPTIRKQSTDPPDLEHSEIPLYLKNPTLRL